MNLYQLTYFKKVAETGSISRAAAELLITQPAVSKQVRALEEELGERLFDRLGKKVFLTRAGEVLYSHADNILRLTQEAKTAVRDISEECSGELIIGTSDHISIHRLPGVLKAYIARYPKVELKLRCHRSETILEMAEKNLVDLAVITLPGGRRSHLVTETIWEDPMSLVLPAGAHPLEGTNAARLKDAATYGIILPEKGTTTRKTIDAVFSKKGLTPNVTMEVAYIETIKGLVKAGLGISILPDRAISQEVRAGSLAKKPLTDAVFRRELGVVYLKGKFMARPAAEFLKLLKEK